VLQKYNTQCCKNTTLFRADRGWHSGSDPIYSGNYEEDHDHCQAEARQAQAQRVLRCGLSVQLLSDRAQPCTI